MFRVITIVFFFISKGLCTALLVWPARWISWIWYCLCVPIATGQLNSHCDAAIDAVTAAAFDFWRIVDIQIEWLDNTVGVYPTLFITVVTPILLSWIGLRLGTRLEAILDSATATFCRGLIGVYLLFVLLMFA